MAVSSTMYDWEVLKSLGLQFVQLNQITSIATYRGYGDNCALLLTQSGKVFAIGKSSEGILGLGEVTETAEPVELKELSGVAGVCVCGSYGDALTYTSEGEVYVWGNNVSWKRPQLVPELTDVVDARCSMGHYLALTKSGKLYEWRGVDTWSDELDALSTTPKVVTLNEVITSIACGPVHSLALTKDGQVYSWGKKYNSWAAYVDQPMTQILLPETVAKIACGVWHSLVLTHSGKLYTWGRNVCGLGDPSGSTKSQSPVQVGQNIGRFVDIALNGRYTNAAVSNTGAVYMWGAGENCALKTLTATDHLELHQVFVNISGNYSWKPKTPSSNTVVVKDSSSVAGKLKASCNDEHDCNEAAIIELEGHVQLNCNTLEQSQTNKNRNHTEAKINHLEEYVENLKKEFAKLKDELKEENIILKEGNAKFQNELKEEIAKLKEENIKLKEDKFKFKDELKEEFNKLKEDTTNFKDELKAEIVKLKNELKEDNANLKKDIAKLKDEPKGDDGKLRDEFKYPTTVVSPREQDCNEAAIIEPEGHVQLNCNTLEQSQTNMDCNHAEAKIHHSEEYVENLKKEFAKLKDELKEEHVKLKEDYVKFKDELKEENTNFKDELKGEIVKLINKLKEDYANLKEDIAKLKDEPKGGNGKLRDEFKYPTTVISPREQEEKGKHNEAAITQPEERGLQLPLYLAQLEHDPTNADSSNNIEEDNANLKKELAILQDRFKNLKALLFPQEIERSSCENNKDREIQKGRRGRITPTTASVTYKDNNQNKQRDSSCEDNKDREIQRGRRGRITPTTASVTYKDNNQNKQ